jgi:hypothetical protein
VTTTTWYSVTVPRFEDDIAAESESSNPLELEEVLSEGMLSSE